MSGYLPPSKRTRWGSPPELVAALAAELGPFDLDVCGDDELHVCDLWFGPELNGLLVPWFGKCWCNPPYGDEGLWVHKAIVEVFSRRAERAVMLLPAKTSTAWWHELIEFYGLERRFLPKRLTFVGAQSCAPFASVVVVV